MPRLRIPALPLLALACAAAALPRTAAAAPEGELLVRIDDAKAAAAAHRAIGARRLERLNRIGVERIRLPPGLSVEAALARYRAMRGVRFAEPNRIVRKSAAPPDDPRLGDQWALPALSVLSAWDAIPVTPTVVAVVDTGIRLGHEDLAPSLWTNTDPLFPHGVRVKDGVLDGNPEDDDVADSHGTHVAGIIGAAVGNGLGVAGVAGIPGAAQLMAVKVLHGSAGEGTLADLVAGIGWAVQHGARVVNLSLDMLGDPSPSLEAALADADASGVLVVSAAGNRGQRLRDAAEPLPAGWIVSPASIRTANNVAVAATDASGELAGYSDHGRTVVDLAAPGGAASYVPSGILSTAQRCTDANLDGVCDVGSPVPAPGYDYLAGTSMAAPQVSGVAALVWSHAPSLTPHRVRARLLNAAVPAASLAEQTISGGRLDAALAVGAAVELPAVFKVLPYEPSGGETVTITGANFGAPLGVATLDGTPLAVISWSDEEILAQLPADARAGVVRVNGTGSGFFLPVGGYPPVVALTASVVRGRAPLAVDFIATTTDPDGNVVRWEWDFGDGTFREYASITTGASVTYREPRSYRTRLRVTDDLGRIGEAFVDVVATRASDPRCFIATAAFGAGWDPHVAALREFRDRTLLPTAAGRALVGLYYRWSPPIAGAIARHAALRAVTRALLLPVALSAENPSAALSTALVLSAAGVAARRWRRRRP